MTRDLILHEVTGSPNSTKVRVALGYKGLPYTRIPVDFSQGFPGDRTAVVAASTQARTPVLVDGERSLFDSGAILRYLDANFPDSPRLFTEDYALLGEIENWESFARAELGPIIGSVFGEAMQPEPKLETCRQASASLNESAGRIEAALSESPYLMGDALSAADIVCASWITLGALPAKDDSPLHAFFRANLDLGAGRDATRAWLDRVLKHDEVYPK